MIELIPPAHFVRMIPHVASGRTRPSKWHVQNRQARNKTQCGIIIAPGYGWRYHNPARSERMKRRERWERIPVDLVRAPSQICRACLGPLEIKK